MDVEQHKREVEAKPEKPLTRQQRRMMERVNQEAHQRLRNLIDYYWEFFMDNDPLSDEVAEKQKEVSAKWKMYCHSRNLKKEAFKLCDEKIEELRVQYFTLKNEPEPIEETLEKA